MKFFGLYVAIAILMVNRMGDCGPVGTTANFIATDIIQAEDFNDNFESQHGSGATAGDCSEPEVVYVGYNTVNSYLGYYNVDFGAGVELIQVRLASWVSVDVYGVIYVYLDNMDTEPIAEIPVRTTTEGDYCRFFALPAFLVSMPTGLHHVFFKFSQPQGKPFVNIDWFTFK